ncbi:MAG: hypothetical protein LLG16_05450 [Euryarchaeota archaeon]|nr:hypothetical protein [Euryarchaeota archaeon]
MFLATIGIVSFNLGIATRGDIISLFLTIFGAFFVMLAFFIAILTMLTKEIEPLNNYIKEPAVDPKDVSDAIHDNIRDSEFQIR